MANLSLNTFEQLFLAIKQEINRGKKAIEHQQALTYWNVGKLIKNHLLENKDRADYGDHLFEKLEKRLKVEQRTLYQSVQFYENYPILSARSKLDWSHYRQLITIEDKVKRRRLERKTLLKDLSARGLQSEVQKVKKRQVLQSPKKPSVKKITPLKGKLYTYKIKEVQAHLVLVDCGFKVLRAVALEKNKISTVGSIVESVSQFNSYSLNVLATTERDLYTYKAFVEKIIDADTIKVKIDLGFETFIYQTLRLRGIDAPEINTSVGAKAKRFVQKVLRKVPFILIRSSKSDKYDRYLADVFYGQEERFLNQDLLDNHLAMVW